MVKTPRFIASTLAVLFTYHAHADDLVLQRVAIDGSRTSQLGLLDAANAGSIGQKKIESMGVARPGEMLEAIPGVIVSQHSGEGKANQFFLRGFNLDHGTDLRTTLDDMPLNQRSHAHGQGWTDLNFLIPELTARIDYKKGPYSASNGDFATAGSAAILYANRLTQNIASLTLGEYGFRRALIAASPEVAQGSMLYALEASHHNGPFTQPDRYRKLNGVLRYSEGFANNGWTVSAMAYQAHWRASDQIPERAVLTGQLGRFDTLDTSDGGESQRYSLSSSWRRSTSDEASKVTSYLIYQNLDLYSNFTYFDNDPQHGDQFAQPDRRTTSGVNANHTWHTHFNNVKWDISVGMQVQHDHIQNALNKTEQRQQLEPVRRDRIQESSLGFYIEGSTLWTHWLRSNAGMRSDWYRFRVHSDQTINSGQQNDAQISPYLNLIFAPWEKTELYLNLGKGFHSNDARATTLHRDPQTQERTSPTPGLTAARASELGLRAEWLPAWRTTASLYRLDFDSELSYLGDAGTTEASSASRRTGIEITHAYRLSPQLSVELDTAYTKARQKTDPTLRLVGAVEGVAQLAFNLEKLGQWSGALRLRYVGPRPLTEDNQVRARSSTTLNGKLRYQYSPKVQFEIEAFNLANRANKAIEYYYASRLKHESQAQEDRHFHPAEPRSFRVRAVWGF